MTSQDHGVAGSALEAMLSGLVESSSDAIIVLDGEGRTVYANAATAALLGTAPGDPAALELFPTVARSMNGSWARHLEHLREGAPGRTNFDLPLHRADGTRVWTLASWGPITLPDGTPGGWHRLAENPGRTRLSQERGERRQQLADAHEIARVASWEWLPGTETMTWSDELFRIAGLEPGEFEPTFSASLALLHPADRQSVLDDLGADLELGDSFHWESRGYRPDGELRWLRGLGVVDVDRAGAGLRVRGMIHDVTDLVQTAADADEARERLLMLQEISEAANRADRLDEALDAACEALRRRSTWAPVAVFVADDDRDALWPLTGLAAGHGQERNAPAPATGDGTSEHADGTDETRESDARRPGFLSTVAVPDLETTGRPDPDPDLAEVAWHSTQVQVRPTPGSTGHSVVMLPIVLDGRTCCVVQLHGDEDPPRAASHRLMLQIAGQLANVAARERDAARLAEARDEAEQGSRMKSEFLATMSHEIRTPMNGVIGLTELLLRSPLDQRQRTLAEALRGTGHTLLAIINDILDLSKIESGRLEMDAEPFEVSTVVEQAVGVVSGAAREKGLELVALCEPDLPSACVGDPLRLGQVLTNLVSNAVKFTDTGEVVVHARREPSDPCLLRVDVVDTGMGLDPGAVDSLFDAFTQADPSSTRRHGGTGLGLAICRRLVTALGGDIGVTSAPGLGSTFWFTVPLHAAPTSDGPVEDLLRDTRVLVADDNDAALRALTLQLDAWGADVVAVSGAEEVLDALGCADAAGTAYDLVLLDRSLPGAGPEEIAPAAGPSSPPLVLLNDAAPDEAAEPAGDGWAGVVDKPVRREDLRRTVLTALGREHLVTTRDGEDRDDAVRVLLVEDNAVNQLVATGLLESLGCLVDVAVDGEQALERLPAGHGYELVLMDCRMPRLDGQEATRRLRRREALGPHHDDHVPVVAMTASVLDGERERCLAAGMDDYLTKPVDRDALSRTLARWAAAPHRRHQLGAAVDGRHPATTPGTEVPITTDPELLYPDEDPTPVLDFARVEMLRELVKDGITFFDRTRESYLERIDHTLEQLRRAAMAQDHAAASGLAHQLKGSSANLGLQRVARDAAAIDEAARAAEGGSAGGHDITPLLAGLGVSVTQARRALDSVGRTAASRGPIASAETPGR